MKVAGFEWDAGNREKCQKHGVSLVEIEALFSRPIMMLPDQAHSMNEARLKAIGCTETGRHIFVVFTLREHHGRKTIRPISARYMHQKEVDSYETANPDV
jgi:uncharacterized DUF497 family protein